METVDQFEKRKADHIRIALDPRSQPASGNGLNRVQLEHEALPDIDFSKINIEQKLLGHTFNSPLFVSSMTAGHGDGVELNIRLAKACAEKNWPMAVGSQRRQLFDQGAQAEWQKIRDEVKDVQFIGNIGIAQLIESSIEDIDRLAKSLNARAMIVHTNPLQEALQPEGTTQFSGCWQALEKLCNKASYPVIVKETGCGFSQSTLKKLDGLDLAAIDVAGFGGTHWGRVEGDRSPEDSQFAKAALTFGEWGNSTLDSLLAAKEIAMTTPVWASGGIKNGLDAAKTIALGAQAVGFAKPMMEAALISKDEIIKLMDRFEFELKIALFCTGFADVDQFRSQCQWKLDCQ